MKNAAIITTNATGLTALLTVILTVIAAFGFDLKVEPDTLIMAGIGLATLIQSVGLLAARDNNVSDQEAGARPEGGPQPAPVQGSPPVIIERRAAPPIIAQIAPQAATLPGSPLIQNPSPAAPTAPPATSTGPIEVIVAASQQPIPVTETPPHA